MNVWHTDTCTRFIISQLARIHFIVHRVHVISIRGCTICPGLVAIVGVVAGDTVADVAVVAVAVIAATGVIDGDVITDVAAADGVSVTLCIGVIVSDVVVIVASASDVGGVAVDG